MVQNRRGGQVKLHRYKKKRGYGKRFSLAEGDWDAHKVLSSF